MWFWMIACTGPDECVDKACDSAVEETGETGHTGETGETADTGPDADGDGWTAAEDCDDDDATLNPGQTEICYDGIDNNCSGTPDDCGWIGDMQTEAYGHLVSGEVGNDAAGLALDACADVDGDGAMDVLLGAPNHSSTAVGQGAVYLVRGPFDDDVELFDSQETKLLGAEESGAALGTVLRFVPDLDADGLPDLLVVGGRFNDIDDGARSPAVYLLPGTVRGAVTLDAYVPLVPAEDHDGMGTAVAVTDDRDGDGRPTLFLAAPDGGKVYRLDAPAAGADLAAARVITGPEGFGADVAVVGDLDGDGTPELAVSGAAGVYVFPIDGANSEADAVALVAHDSSGTWAPKPGQILGGGDLDGDGGDDLVLSAPEADTSDLMGGRVCVWAGTALGLDSALSDARGCVEGEHAGEALGAALSAPGDVDNDGVADLLVGVPANSKYESSHGAVLVLAGPITSTIGSEDARAHIYGETSYQLTGTTLSGACDLTADGVDDLLIGAPGVSSRAGNAGGAFVFPGIDP